DAVAEFKVITGIAPAEYGRGGGAIISAVTKSGTNQWHGSLFEFFRNNNLDARNFFAAKTSHLRRNQFGGMLGGPVVKNRSFFFVNADVPRERTAGAPPIYVVPTDQLRNGIFPGVIRDPFTGVPFPNNTIPRQSMNPISLRLQSFYPLPNNPAGPSRKFIYYKILTSTT